MCAGALVLLELAEGVGLAALAVVDHERAAGRDHGETGDNLGALGCQLRRDVEELVALAARHLGHLAHREGEQSTVFAIRIDDRDADETLGRGHGRRHDRQRILRRIEYGLAGFAVGDQILEPRRKAVSGIRGQQPQTLGVAHHHARETRAIGRIEAPNEWLAKTTRRRQRVRRQAIGTPCGVEKYRRLQRHATHRRLKGIAGFVLQ